MDLNRKILLTYTFKKGRVTFPYEYEHVGTTAGYLQKDIIPATARNETMMYFYTEIIYFFP